MGFFKKIGSSLKRVVSLKNVVRGVTGQFGAIAQDAVRIATTDAPVKDSAPAPVVQNPIIPQPINDILDAQGANFSKKIVQEVAKTDTAQDATSFLAKIGMESMYQKYKTWITVFFVALGAFILYRLFRHKDGNNQGKRVAKRR